MRSSEYCVVTLCLCVRVLRTKVDAPYTNNITNIIGCLFKINKGLDLRVMPPLYI